MIHSTKTLRALAMTLVMAMLLSVVPAFAAEMPKDVYDAKDELATVDITQIYNGKETDKGYHDYTTMDSKVGITYEATLRMTEEMAMYLHGNETGNRQKQLMKAAFVVHIDMDMDTLEFTTDKDTVSVSFTSTFLKPCALEGVGGYSYKLDGVKNGVFHYTVTAPKAWAERQDCFDIPMELIVYSDGEKAYGYDEALRLFPGEKSLFYNFTVEDWMAPIKLTLADLRVRGGVEKTITTDAKTWRTVKASGTVDGTFSYARDYKINTIGDYALETRPNTLEFGNTSTIEEWKSNEVSVRLVREGVVTPPSPGEEDKPDSPYLNLEDHFAYIIGYPDGKVHPEGSITRAEVATIFFRMLTDETRDAYWSKTNSYPDVKADHWFNNAVSTLSNLGIVDGYPDGTFRPNGKITRAEFATMAVRFFIITEEFVYDEDAFSDIATHWANKYINIAYLLGIINGYPDGTYRPGNAITRAEAMKIVNNTLRRSPCNEGLLPVEEMIMWPDNMRPEIWYYADVQEATNSHAYEYFTGSRLERWTAELPVRDWHAFEDAWATANAAENPGEVVDGKDGVNGKH